MDKFEVLVEATQNLKLLFNKISIALTSGLVLALYFFNLESILKAEIDKSPSSVAIWDQIAASAPLPPGEKPAFLAIYLHFNPVLHKPVFTANFSE